MGDVSDTKLSLQVVINKQKSKVLFAEANSYLTDLLLGFLTLPLAKIIQILDKHYGNTTDAPVIGSLTTLFRNLFTTNHFSSADDEQCWYLGSTSLHAEFVNAALALTKCHSSFCRDCPHSANTSTNKVSEFSLCHPSLTVKATTFIISDDLHLVPMGSTGFLQALTNLGISDINGAERMSFSFGIDHAVDLLMLSLVSSTPLTELVFNDTGKNSIATKREPISQHIASFNGERINSFEMSFKVWLQKSTNIFLFAETTEDFVAFLFSVATLPLGGALQRLDGKTPFNNINNIYNSVADFIEDEYFVDQDTKRRLLNPKISRGYFSADQIVKNDCMKEYTSTGDLIEYEYFIDQATKKRRINPNTNHGDISSDQNVKSDGKNQKLFILNDDLVVAPYSMASIVLILNNLQCPLSDVKEMDLNVGKKEALRIMEASLTSKTAITDALINPMLNLP